MVNIFKVIQQVYYLAAKIQTLYKIPGTSCY